jgi:hypothetical protein
LSKLVTGGHLEQVPVDSATCRELVHQARNHALTAVAAREIGDFEGAFQIAYDGCRKVCLALALAYGVRAKGDTGHHATTFNAAAATLSGNVAARDLVDDATDLRFVRAGSEYRAEKITLAAVNDAIDILGGLLAALPPVMDARLAK